MLHFILMRLALATSLILGFPFALKAEEAGAPPSPDAVVSTLEKISGVHKGIRRNHSKGVCAEGFFEATPAARDLSVSRLFSGEKIPLVARFSVAGPNPAVPDAAKNPRGFALQYRLPGGDLHQMAMLNTPVFGAATVQTFYDRLLADVPDPATGKRDPEKLKAFLASHPDAREMAQWLATHNPPPSYANTTYFSLHAFKFIDGAKQGRWVRWRFEPRDGVLFLGDDEMASLPKDFLAQRLTDRTRAGPVQWDMIVTLAEPGDPIDNPTIAWPRTRREVNAGTLTLTKAGDDVVAVCDDINFDPNEVSAGVEPSPDPILEFRSPAYAVSFGRRLDEKGK